MHRNIATAMALALVVGAVGLSIVPVATAGHSDCHGVFMIPDLEPLDVNARDLDAV